MLHDQMMKIKIKNALQKVSLNEMKEKIKELEKENKKIKETIALTGKCYESIEPSPYDKNWGNCPLCHDGLALRKSNIQSQKEILYFLICEDCHMQIGDSNNGLTVYTLDELISNITDGIER